MVCESTFYTFSMIIPVYLLSDDELLEAIGNENMLSVPG